MSERLLRVREVAELTGCGRSTIYRAIEQGRLRAVGTGSLLRVPEAAIADWLRPVAPRSAGPMPAPRSRPEPRRGRFAAKVTRLEERRAG